MAAAKRVSRSATNALPYLTLRPSWQIAVLPPPLISHGSPVTPTFSLEPSLHISLASPAGAVLFTIAIPLFVGRIVRGAMCNFFADGDVEIEERPRRHPNEPRRTRLSFVRPNDRSSPRHSGEIEVYRRPRSSGTIVVNHPREEPAQVRYEEPLPTYDPAIPIPPAAPIPPRDAYYGTYQPAGYQHHSRSNSSSDYSRHGLNRRHSNRTSYTHSHHNSDDPIILVESSPQKRARMPQADRNGRRVITTTTRPNRRESRHHDDDDRDSFFARPRSSVRRRHDSDDGDSFVQLRQKSLRARGDDDDRDSWTEEARPATRRGLGGRSGGVIRR